MIDQQEFEAWAIARAHQIILHEGMQLAQSAQYLDKIKLRSDVYRLRQAIADCLIEVRQGNISIGTG